MCANVVIILQINKGGRTMSFRLTFLMINSSNSVTGRYHIAASGFFRILQYPDRCSVVSGTDPCNGVGHQQAASSSGALQMENTSDQSVRDFWQQEAACLGITIPGPQGQTQQVRLSGGEIESWHCYHEVHWSMFVAYCWRKHHQFCRYLLHLIAKYLPPSPIVSHRTSIVSVLRHRK